MKKRSFLKLGLATACLAAFTGGFVACDDGGETSGYADLRLDRTSYIFNVGETIELNVLDGNDEVSGVIWSSKKPEFVTVDENGKITAIAKGSTTVTATVDGKELTCSLTVRDRMVELLSDYEEVEIDIDDSSENFPRSLNLEVVVDVNRVNAEVDVTWTSADPTIATVENGIVSALKKGETTVTASTVISGETYSRDFSVFVYPEYLEMNNEASFLKIADVEENISFDYSGVGEVEFVELDGVQLGVAQYEISDGKLVLDKSSYAQAGVVAKGRHQLYVSEIKNESQSNKYSYPFVLADYVVDSKDALAAMPTFLAERFGACYGTQNRENSYIVLGANVDFGNQLYNYSGLSGVGAYFRYSTFDGYGHAISNIKINGWGLFGSMTDSKVRDLAIVNATVTGYAAVCGTLNKSSEVKNVFVSGEGTNTATKFLLAGTLARTTAVGSVEDCVVIDYSNLGGSATKGALGRIQQTTKVDGNVIVTDGYALADMGTGEEAISSDYVKGTNIKLSHSDKVGLIAALKELASKNENWSFNATTNELSLNGNVVYTVVTE